MNWLQLTMEKASKWDSLIKWIKATASDDDSDVWEKLEELGVNASGGVGEEEEFECYKCENTHNIKMFSRWEKGFVEEEPNAICKDCEEEVCCGGCNGEICNDCPVDNTSNRYFKCSGCKKYEIEEEDDYKEGYISTICHSCMFGTGDCNQVYKKELAGI